MKNKLKKNSTHDSHKDGLKNSVLPRIYKVTFLPFWWLNWVNSPVLGNQQELLMIEIWGINCANHVSHMRGMS